MIKQMLKKVMVTESGDSGLSAGQTLSRAHMTEINDQLLDEGKTPAQFSPIMLGISKSAVETDSFLSAASFQETTRVLTDAAVKGKVDHLEGLKENVIIGKLIPAGTGRPEYERETTKRIIEKADKMIEERRAKAAALAEATATKLPDDVLGNEEEDDFPAADQNDSSAEKTDSSEPEEKDAE